MVDILSAVLSGGNWGPTVDGFTAPTNQKPGGLAGDAGAAREAAGEAESPPTGIGHFFGALRIDGFRDADRFKSTMDQWIGDRRPAQTLSPCVRALNGWAAHSTQVPSAAPSRLTRRAPCWYRGRGQNPSTSFFNRALVFVCVKISGTGRPRVARTKGARARRRARQGPSALGFQD